MPTVLVVDDHAELLLILVEFLRSKRYQVEAAESAETAIKILNATPIDAVVADLRLPGSLTGIDILLHHKKIAPTGCRILSSAIYSDKLSKVCRYLNLVYLPKPVEFNHLVNTIESALSARV